MNPKIIYLKIYKKLFNQTPTNKRNLISIVNL